MESAADERVMLPEDMCPENTCFFTGHRFISEKQLRHMYTPLVRCILQMAEDGCRYFLDGGALGFDLLAARTAVLLRQEFQKDIRLVLALPCRDQTARWLQGSGGLENIRRYHEIKAHAQAVVYVTDFYTDGCMRERNRFMVEHSARCIAFWNGSPKGGTAQTVRMAKDAGIPVWNLYPVSGETAVPPEHNSVQK